MAGPRLATFCHVPKTAGTTLLVLLRRSLGLRHADIAPRCGRICDVRDLRIALRLYPRAISIAGHGLRPFVDYEEFSEQLSWYTVLREPIARSISNYQHQVERMGRSESLETWLDRPENRNWHVRMLSGGQHLEVAKRTLERMRCFGSVERLAEFLVLLRSSMGWPELKLDVSAQRNTARRGSVAAHIREHSEDHEPSLRKANELDLELYRYAMDELYPRRIQEYGEERLEAEIGGAMTHPCRSDLVRGLAADAYRRGGYKPLVRVMRGISRARGDTPLPTDR
jgi:hypothetical protein